MTHFKTLLVTAALIAVPAAASAQVPTDAVEDKAVKSVMENMTTDDAVIAGETMIQGGSKEDAAIAIVKNRADMKIDEITGGVRLDAYSQDGVMAAGKDIAMQKVTGSNAALTGGVSLGPVSPSDISAAGGLEAGKAMALEQARAKARAMSMEKARNNAAMWGMSERDKAKMMITSGQVSGQSSAQSSGQVSAQSSGQVSGDVSGEAYVIQKSGVATSTQLESSATVSTLNCPTGTTDDGNGSCMITGDWEP